MFCNLIMKRFFKKIDGKLSSYLGNSINLEMKNKFYRNLMAEKYNKTIAQICIRYSLQKGYLPLPKSANTSRIQENIQVFDFVISDEDMEFIENIPNYCSEGSDPDNCDF